MANRSRIRALNVAEKPSVAKRVSEILSASSGGMRSRDGRSRYNRVFEFEYSIRSQLCHMVFTSVTGHLMELEFDDRYRKWHSCDPADLYTAPVKKFVPQDKLDIKRTLEEEARNCQWLVLWLDCDREGENIAFEVVEVCTAVNHRLVIWRAHFSALNEGDILASVQNLVQPNKLFADAVDARQEIDLRIGASFTRFQTMLLKDAFVLDFPRDDRSVVLSYGPCQFPTLGFIVERYWEIQAHEPEEFWTINCSHTSDEGTTIFKWIYDRSFDYTCAVATYEMCVEEPTATVKNVKHVEELRYPPYPLSTVQLLKRASTYLGISSERTMKVAEELYMSGFISYPRTETDSFSVNSDLKVMVREQIGHPTWGSYAQQLLDPQSRLWRNPSNGGHDDKAHPPIHPTKFSSGESGWSQDHNRLYELVVRHFLACVSQPAVGAKTTVEIDIAGAQFSASGRTILAKNYLDVYKYDSWGASVIPAYVLGQQFLPTTLTLDSGLTRPPPLLKEADLIGCMDKAGIGTDATMQDHIKKLLDRHYARKDTNTFFSPTTLGEALVMGYDDMGYELWKPYLRSKMEEDMKEVSIGTKRKSEILESCLREVKAVFLDARRRKENLLEAMELFFERSNRPAGDAHNGGEVVRRCNACHESDMVLRPRLNGDFMVGCLRFPLCRNVVWLPGATAEAVVTTNLCSSCAPGPVFKIHFKFRRLEILPNYDVDHLGCIGGCDAILRELIEICGTGSRMPSGCPARGQRAGETPNSTRRGNLGRDVCAHCRQTGHSSNECPSQGSRSRSAQSSRVQNSRNNIGQIPCESCGASCPLRTAATEQNRGRKFFSCQNQECGFFVWEDNLGSGGAQGRGGSRGGRSNRVSSSAARRGSGGRGGGDRGQRGGRNEGSTFVSATGEPLSGRCFVCGDPSHFANACPNRGR